jgi:hypothetical protein
VSLWKVFREAYGEDRLLTVLEADSATEALAKAQGMHFEMLRSRPTRAEEAVPLDPPRPLRIAVGKLLELDAGTLVCVANPDGDLRIVLAPARTLFEQVVDFLLKQPGPPATWQPTLMDEGAAAARLVFRWGSYFAVIGDAIKPEWTQGIPLGISRYNDYEQARMSIEISSNMEAIYHLKSQQPEKWRHLAYAARLLSKPKRTDDAARSVAIHTRLVGGEEALMRRTWKALGRPGLFDPSFSARKRPVDPETLAAFDLNPVRRIMNVVALSTWRSPMEEYHGDSGGAIPEPRPTLPLDQCRFTLKEMVGVERRMAEAGNGLMQTIEALHGRTEEELRLLLAEATIEGEAGSKWSITERTRNIILW